MATIWKGAINFGLINIPIKLLGAIDKKSIAFRSLHKKCKTPINQKRWCNVCDKEVEYDDIVKGFEYEKGAFVVITEQQLKSIPVKSTKYIQIIDFIKLDEVDQIYFDKPYYLSPEANGEKPYLILYNAMKETNTVAVSKITIKERETLCLIRVYKDILALNTMVFGNEVRSTAEINMDRIQKSTEMSKIEMQIAKEIIKNLTTSFDETKYHDQYTQALQKLINAKVEGKEIVQPSKQPADSTQKSLDLFEKLKASLEATKKSKQEKEQESVLIEPTKKSKSTKQKKVNLAATNQTKKSNADVTALR